MQRQSYGHEQPSPLDEVIVTNRFLSLDSIITQETPTNKAQLNINRFSKPSRLATHAEIIRRDILSPVPFKKCDDIIEIRPNRKRKPTANGQGKPSIVKINVSGVYFQTYLSTLELYPNTLLGDKNKRKLFWNAENGEYFFDRHRACFEAILYYYQSHGRLRRPSFVPLDTFFEEVAFFELGAEALDQVHKCENVKPVKHKHLPRQIWRRYIWFYIEYPQHSYIARAINLFSIFFTVLSCTALAVESLPQYTDHWDDICKLAANISLNSTYVPRCPALFNSPFFIIQTVCVSFFTIELVLRLISTPSYRRFVFSFFNWVDLTSIVPYYVFLAIQIADKDIGLNTNALLCIRLLRILRFTRIFKIYLIFQRLKSLRVLSAAIRESLLDFTIIMAILASVAFLFGAATYFAEEEANGDVFDSIPKSIYWGIITISGVGYGDMCPITAIGRVITCLCALVGSATMGMLTSVLVDRYQRVYNRKMYTSESESSPADFDINDDLEDDVKSIRSRVNSSGIRRTFSGTLSHSLPSFQARRKADRNQSYKLQFIVSYQDRCATDHVTTIIKDKLTETISTIDVGVDIKLVDEDKKELWNISSLDSRATSTSKVTLSTDDDDDDDDENNQSNIESF